MEAGTLSAQQLVGMYLARIEALDRSGPMLNSVIELNPDALNIAIELDRERAAGQTRGPLHGIPIMIKDNIDTADKMLTTAGSLALVDSQPLEDSTTAAHLRAAGAIILGKTNLSEWANFRAFNSSSGWSGRGGQTKNPSMLDRNPCGSSSGSGAAAAASLCAVAIGTETDGSIVCPSHNCGLAGIKPTVGLTSRAGVIPISHTQDTIGPMARTVADAAAVLGAMTGVDPRDSATEASEGHFETDYTQFLDPEGLQGARIGIARAGVTGYSTEADWVYTQAIQALHDLGAEVIDPTDIPTATNPDAGAAEFEVLLYEFKADLAAYLATRSEGSPRTLADLIVFNEEHKYEEMPFFGQEIFLASEEKGPLTDPAYLEALETSLRLSREEGLDAVFAEYELDAIVAPTGQPAWPIDLINGDHFLGASSGPAAMAGYPLITVPMGYVWGLPVGLTFMGLAWSEPTLIKLASGFEHGVHTRIEPMYLPTLVV
jgi:amidase